MRAFVAAVLLLSCGGAAADDIARARYAAPTDRYRHAVLGDALEWAALEVETADGRVLRYTIPDDSVFEDIAPRLFDIDGDGAREAWVVRSDAADGARLEAYAIDAGVLSLRYAGPAIGQGFRWLNPVGVADFNGDGRNEAAYVETPHIGGILTVLRPAGGRLEIVARLGSYSTHAIGSTRLDLAAIHDFDGDGAVEIVLPTPTHNRLAVVGMADGKLVELWRSYTIPLIGGGLTIDQTAKVATAEYKDRSGVQRSVRIGSLLRP